MFFEIYDAGREGKDTVDTLLKRAVFRRYSARRRAVIWPEETQCRVVRCEKNAWRQVIALQASVTDVPGKRKGGNTSLMVEHVIDQYDLKGYLLTVVLGDGDLIVRSYSSALSNIMPLQATD